MMDNRLKTILAELSDQLETVYGARLTRLVLYGSQARGEAQPGSDIDVLVVLEGPVDPGKEIERTGGIVAGLSLKYDEVISCIFVSRERFETEESPLLVNVRQEGITAWPSTKNRLPSREGNIQELQGPYVVISEMNGQADQNKDLTSSGGNSEMTPDQSALLRKASDSLQAAQLLADQGFYDFAVSRAYYAMFYVASAFLRSEGFTFSKHSTAIALFGQYMAKTGRIPTEFHRYLIDAENSRKVGDYELGSSLSNADANIQIARAEQFLELTERLIGPVP